MDEETKTKVIIAGSVGGASMLSVTLIVLAALLCRHRMKETRRKKKLLQREETQVASSSESSSPQETTDGPTPLPSSSDTGSSVYPSEHPIADLSGSYTPRTSRSVNTNSCPMQADSPDPASDSTLSYKFQPMWTSSHSSQDYSNRVFHSSRGALQHERVSRELSITIYPAYPSRDYVELDGRETRQVEVLNGDAYTKMNRTGEMKSSVT
ncbi:hypothetical protein CAPTEDRAFT_227165 [Capitella teleta]|uniref:Uncharacterized protein n=1 Tax=Capitella teleta TaxID=283909 RepID=R7UP82_CAPTE|nr:hypothetical protein CAPTEDRAFT_227165 [Capitella teleta]|eukprot:ELU05206.1 hypothetical protein CAPTEDRAFT_227165 [Capitella teleta]